MRKIKLTNSALLSLDSKVFQPGFSIDCVVLGFHNGNMKILLTKLEGMDIWMLPGGFLYKDENVDDAAKRILAGRTGLTNAYMRQFHLFGDIDRNDIEENKEILRKYGIKNVDDHWYAQRFISIGYYALVNYSRVEANSLYDDESAIWYDLDEIPKLYADHGKILRQAIESIQQQLGYVPIGYELLPEKFTMPEIRSVYEAILGRPLDRRNFQRKMLSVGLITRLDETRKNGAHKAPYLYVFNKERYEAAVEFGTQLMSWNIREL